MPLNQIEPFEFDAPIPGQSLTATPGNAKWEHPPQFTDLDKALTYVFDKMTQPKRINKLLSLLEADVTATSVAETILMAGFTEGKWNPDLMLMMGPAVIGMVETIADKAGIEYRLDYDQKNALITELADLQSLRGERDELPDMELETEVEEEGLMSPRRTAVERDTE